MTRKSRRATRFRRTLELGGSAPQTPRTGLGNPSPKLSTEPGQPQRVVAIRLRKSIRNEWLLVLAGLASVVFGILVFLFPLAGALALVWLISAQAVVTGILLLALAFRARGWRLQVPIGAPAHA